MEQKQEHLQTVKKVKEAFDETKKFAQDEANNAEMFTFDLQRALELPSMSTSVAFYCRKLWVYNLCILDAKRNEAYMYVWDENIASRGAQEISSCLLKHFQLYLPSNTEIILDSGHIVR